MYRMQLLCQALQTVLNCKCQRKSDNLKTWPSGHDLRFHFGINFWNAGDKHARAKLALDSLGIF